LDDCDPIVHWKFVHPPVGSGSGFDVEPPPADEDQVPSMAWTELAELESVALGAVMLEDVLRSHAVAAHRATASNEAVVKRYMSISEMFLCVDPVFERPAESGVLSVGRANLMPDRAGRIPWMGWHADEVL
jgi:hypothetical protein